MNYRTFLTEDELHLTARCYTPVQMFVINKETFTKVVQNDPNLGKKLNNLISSIVDDEKTFDLDLTPTKRPVKTYDRQAKNKLWQGLKAERAQNVSILFKNTVIQLLLKHREDRKVPKLSDILKISIEKQKEAAQAKR